MNNNKNGAYDPTLSSAIVIPRSNPRCTSKAEMELVILTFTKGLVTTVTPPSIVLMVWILLMVRYWKHKAKHTISYISQLF